MSNYREGVDDGLTAATLLFAGAFVIGLGALAIDKGLRVVFGDDD